MHEMHFISRAKYILCATFCEFGRMALHEVHFMYHILAIRTKKPVFHEMKYTKCASCPRFTLVRPNEMHEMHFVRKFRNTHGSGQKNFTLQAVKSILDIGFMKCGFTL